MRRARKKEQYTHAETGEEIEGWLIFPEVRDRCFTKIFDLFSQKLLETLGSMSGEVKLITYIMAKMKELSLDSDSWLHIDHAVAGLALKCTKRSIQNYLQKLMKLKFLEQKQRRLPIYRIPQHMVYRGTFAKLVKKASQK